MIIQLTNQEYEQGLRQFIVNTEARIKSYQTLMEDLHKSRKQYMDEGFDEFKDMLREFMNAEKSSLKELVEEMTNYKQGMNYPFCYPYKK